MLEPSRRLGSVSAGGSALDGLTARSQRPLPAGYPACIARIESLSATINRGDILMLGIASGVTGGLTRGMMLGLGMDLIVNSQPWGWLLMLPGAPAAASRHWRWRQRSRIQA